MLLGSMKTFYGQAHNKGAVPTVYAAHGAYQALADLPGYATPYERLRDTLISVDAQDFSTNAQTLARDDMDIMDEQGTQIDWKRLERRLAASCSQALSYCHSSVPACICTRRVAMRVANSPGSVSSASCWIW